MNVTSLSVVEREQHLAAVDRLVRSQVLHGSESLCKLLRYLAEQSFQNPGVPIKEYQIATEVFGRPADFDPHLDSAIRVQAGRLRVKLGEYYATEGEKDPIIVELPKGTYTLAFHPRPASAPPATSTTAQASSRVRHMLFNWSVGVVALSILLAAGVASLVVGWEDRSRTSIGLPPPPPAVFQ